MTDGDDLIQRRTCRRFSTDFVEAPPSSKIGVARNARSGNWPLNGLRHPPEGDTSGWYVWAGETLSSDPEFFEPVHVSHVADLLPFVLPYLGLPPGWRFLLGENQEDVWYDAKLLQV
jgi:hypothetical protein